MNEAFASVTDDEGVLVRWADVDGMTLAELRFPPGYVQDVFVPDLPYLALVLDGGLEKSFRLRTLHLSKACALTMPVAVAHAARFGPQGARIVIVSVGEYGRRLRLEWAAAEIARSDTPLAMIATQAGFADQSHFTRLFKRHVGTTPAQYREGTQPAGRRGA